MANTPPGYGLRYGVLWPVSLSELDIEIKCVREGGQWTTPKGHVAGKGMFYHFKRVQELLWPGKVWHKWNIMQTEAYLTHRTIGVMGPASSGKTCTAATDALTDYYCFPECTTIICCSTTKERLQDRIFGEMMKYHREAKEHWSECPGHLIEGRLRIVTDSRESAKEGRDFRNGVIGVPCKPGGSYVGLGDFVGIKNKRLRLVADELQLLPHVFIFSVSNLDKNPDFKCLGLGNPKETTDALGALCEPAFELGGWDGGVDQQPGSKTWKTRRPDGVAVQLMGSDSPNLDGKLGIPLITQRDIDRDVAQYGKESLQFTMMNEGMMPRAQGSRRVLTRQLCLKNHAFEDPVWAGPERTKIGFLDAAYGGVGGDRCIFGEMQFGAEAIPVEGAILLSNLLGSHAPMNRGRQILALIDTVLVPVSVKVDVPPEDQIAFWVREECRVRNIVPENFFFDAGMRTALVSTFARIWSPQVVPIDFGGAASERPVSGQMSKLCKDHYSKYVTELWFSVRAIVEAGQFRGMTETILREFSNREWTMVGANKIEVETKKKMKEKTGYSPDLADACFTSGTMILTDKGNQSIETITEGTVIVTPFGLSPVESVHVRDSCDIFKVEFSNGAHLEGTGNHKCFTWKHGWQRIDSLSIDNEIESSDTLWVWNILNTLFTKDESIAFKLLVDTIKIKTGSVSRSDFYIELFGLNTMGKFLMAIASIIEMVTGWTIASKTWNWLKRQNIPVSTSCKGKTCYTSAIKRDWPQRSGTARQKAENGILNTERSLGLEESQLSKSVSNAEKILRHSGQTPNTALPHVHVKSLGERLTILKGIASSAAKLFWRTISRELAIVPVNVQPLQPPASKKVYNLTLRNHNVYYANGILVQNCAIGVEGARRKGFIIQSIESRDGVKVESAWRREVREKAKTLWRSKELVEA